MKIKLYNVKRIKTGKMDHLMFYIDPMQSPSVCNYLERERDDVRYRVTIDNARPRTTGKRSQCSRANGHIQVIAMETGNSFECVKQYVKKLAVDQGYPYETMPDGSLIPKSEADISVEQAVVLCDVINRFAAELDIILPEYDDEKESNV